jgi:LmbE family N-acetylglucosaminyl deacetylase
VSESILVVAAHPDDEVLGCGGTIASLSRTNRVHIAILGEGISSRYDARLHADEAILAQLRSDAEAVANMLGASGLTLVGLPDNRFDEVALLDVVKHVERLVAEVEPSVVYTQHPGDLNIDHLITFRAVMTATRPMVGCTVKDIYTFEVASSTEWAFQRFSPSFQPNVFVDISTTLDMKVRAMARYESEARRYPHPRSEQALRASASRWGTVVGLDAAEAFELVRSIRA